MPFFSLALRVDAEVNATTMWPRLKPRLHVRRFGTRPLQFLGGGAAPGGGARSWRGGRPSRSIFFNAHGRGGVRGLCAAASEGEPEAELDKVELPTSAQLRMLGLASGLPFVGFGFLDNFLMILFGDWIDSTLCVAFSFSTMAAAAIGNTFSDVIGIFAGGFVENWAIKCGIEEREMTYEQKLLLTSKIWQYGGQCIGIVIGCALGACPLLWLDPEGAARLKKQKEQDEIFKSVVVKVGEMLSAEAVALMFTDPEKHKLHSKATTPNLPQEFEWSMDHGFMGHVARTGQFVSVADMREEALYVPALHDDLLGCGIQVRSLLCMPIFSKGQISALFMVVNKDGDKAFNTKDEDVLSAICTHVSTAISDTATSFDEILMNCEKSMVKQGSPEWSISAKQRKMALYLPALNGISNYLDCEATALMLLDSTGTELYTEAIDGKLPKHRQKVGEGVAGQAVERGQILIVDSKDLHWQTAERHRNYQGTDMQVMSEVVVPLFDTSRKCLGAIKCINKNSHGPEQSSFDADDVEYVTQVGQHLQIMLEGPEAGLKRVLALTRIKMQSKECADSELPGILCYVEQAQNLLAVAENAIVDPYVTVAIISGDPLENKSDLEYDVKRQRNLDRTRPVRRFAKTKTILKDRDPCWNESMHITMPVELASVPADELFVHVLVWDYHSIGDDTLVAQVVFPFSSISETRESGDGMSQSYPLLPIPGAKRQYRLDKAKIWIHMSRAGGRSGGSALKSISTPSSVKVRRVSSYHPNSGNYQNRASLNSENKSGE